MNTEKMFDDYQRQERRRRERERKSVVATAKTFKVWTQYHEGEYSDGPELPEPIEHERPITVTLKQHSNGVYSWRWGSLLLAYRDSLTSALEFAKECGWTEIITA